MVYGWGEKGKVLGVVGAVVEIRIVDGGCQKYELEVSGRVLGRMYDNDAEQIVVHKPESEVGSLCTMIITSGSDVVDHIEVGEEPVSVTNAVSRYGDVRIGFSFMRADGYVKNTDVEQFFFLKAQKPDDFVPVKPEQEVTINKVVQSGFTKVEWKEGGHNTLQYLNAAGEVVSEVELSGFVQEQSDLAEADETSETFVRGKKTSNLENDGDGSSPYATQQMVADSITSAIFDSWQSDY